MLASDALCVPRHARRCAKSSMRSLASPTSGCGCTARIEHEPGDAEEVEEVEEVGELGGAEDEVAGAALPTQLPQLLDQRPVQRPSQALSGARDPELHPPRLISPA